MRMPQIIEIPRAAQQVDIYYFHVVPALFYFLDVKRRRCDLPILGKHQSIWRDRGEEVLNIIIRNEVMPAIVESPVGGKRCGRCEDDRSRSSHIRSPNRQGS